MAKIEIKYDIFEINENINATIKNFIIPSSFP